MIIPVIIISTTTDEINGDTIKDRYIPKKNRIIIIDNIPITTDSITQSLSLIIIGEDNVTFPSQLAAFHLNIY